MSNSLEEYKAVEENCGYLHRSDLVVGEFSGVDVKDFLQGALSNDIKQITSNKGLAACFLTPKGKLVASLKLFEKQPNTIYGITSSKEFEFLQDQIKKLILFSETGLSNLSSQFSILQIIGKNSFEAIQSIFNFSENLSVLEVSQMRCESYSISIVRDQDWVLASYFLIIPTEHFEKVISKIQNYSSSSIKKISAETLNIFRVEAGITIFGVDMDEKNFPLEVNLENYISYTKGCYCGQEPISRIKHYGKVNKQLVHLLFDSSEVSIGASVLRNEKEVGRVTSLVYSPHYQCNLALSVLNREAIESEAKVYLTLATSEKIEATVKLL